MGNAYRPCMAPGCHRLVWCAGAARPRCPEHRYPEKAVRSRLAREAAAVVASGPCVHCGAPAQEADHPVPLSQGGDPLAMVPVCRACHVAKTAAEMQSRPMGPRPR
jgi:hypothetical protein